MPQNNANPRLMEKLEDRILFDAVPDGNFLHQEETTESTMVVQNQDIEIACEDCTRELIIVDQNVENSQQLLAEILDNAQGQTFEVQFIDGSIDGIQQITDLLQSQSGQYHGIHIISHGDDGTLNLGNTTLSSSNFSQYASTIGTWGEHITNDGDLLFYGCELASNEQGIQLLTAISESTGADVAASDDLTGNEAEGGDWDLEAHFGAIDVQVLNASEWDGVLNSPPAFNGQAGLFQVYSKSGQLAEIDLDNQNFANAANNAGTKLNAVGFRASDNYAYGVLVETFEIGRLGSNGTVENLGTVTGLPTDKGNIFVGDFGGDDLLYLRTAQNTGVLYGVNIDTMTVENTLTLSQNATNIYDIAYNAQDDHFYTSQRGAENKLLKINATDGTVTTVGNNNLSKLTFGGMFADASGAIYGSANQTGDIYQFNTSTGEATRVGKSNKSGTNDGFANVNVTLELPPFASEDDFTMDSTGPVVSGNLFADNGNGIDVDANGDSISIVSVEGSSGNVGNSFTLDSGVLVTVSANGDFSFDTNGQYDDLVIGQKVVETFEYTITDGDQTSTATCTFCVEGTFDPTGSGNEAGMDILAEETDVTNLSGMHELDRTTIKSAGDFNNDGYEDVIVGDWSVNDGRGATYVVYGDAQGLPSNFDVTSLTSANGGDGSQGLVINGILVDDQTGSAVAAAGDLNGDGIDDIIIGATDADTNGKTNTGAGYVVFGSSSHGAELELSSLTTAGGGDGSQGFVVNGIDAYDMTGAAVAGVGDVNNDGIDDVAITATDAEVGGNQNVGRTYVVYGSNSGFSAEIDAEDMTIAGGGDGSQGVVVNGVSAHDQLGADVTGGHDVNNDGIDDFVITSRYADAMGLVDSGQSYLIHGSASFGAEYNLADLLADNGGDGSEGTVIHGSDKQTGNGGYVKMVADANSDGLGELTMGVGSVGSSQSYVVNGGSKVLDSELQMVSLKPNGVYLDNFDSANSNFDQRSWDKYMNNITLHSTEGTQVTIWGDPHVVTNVDGVESIFDIGYGPGTITLSTGTQISWTTYDHNLAEWPLGPPLEDFSLIFADSNNNQSYDTADGLNYTDQTTALTEDELREFAIEIAKYAGLATEPLTYNG